MTKNLYADFSRELITYCKVRFCSIKNSLIILKNFIPCKKLFNDILQMILKLETITKEREMHMERLWKEFQSVLNSYLKYTEEYRDEYIDLRNRDAEDTRSIQDHYNGNFWTRNYLT